MPLVNKTKRQIRADILNSMFGEFTVITGETATVTDPSTITFPQYANLMPDSHWDRGTIRAIVGSAAETRKIRSFDGSGCTFGTVTPFSSAPQTTNIEVIRSGVNLNQVDTAIDRAANATARTMIVDVSDAVSMVWDVEQSEYQLPSGRFVRVDDQGGVQLAWQANGLDRYRVSEDSQSLIEHGLTTTLTQLAQGFTPNVELLIDLIVLPIRRLGTVDYSLTASIWSDAAGLPGILLASSAPVLATAIGSGMRAQTVFALTVPARVAPQARCHLVLRLTAASGSVLSATDSFLWLADTAGAAVNGSPSASTDGGVTFTAQSGYTRGFYVTDAREKDFRRLESDEYTDVPGSTRTLLIKPDNGPQSPALMRVTGQGPAPSIAGSVNDGTIYQGDPEVLTSLAIAYLLVAQATAARNADLFRMAKQLETDALEKARGLMPRLRGIAIERL